MESNYQTKMFFMKKVRLNLESLKVQSFVTDTQLSDLKGGCPQPSANEQESCDGQCFSQGGQKCGPSWDKSCNIQ